MVWHSVERQKKLKLSCQRRQCLCFSLVLIFFKTNDVFIFLAPSEVQNLQVVETSQRKVNLTWNVPKSTNGVLTAYVIEYRGRKSDLVSLRYVFLFLGFCVNFEI